MSSGERRRLVVLGCVFGVLAAVFVAKTFLLSGSDNAGTGSSSAASTPFTPRTAASPTTAKRSGPATTTIATAPPATFQVYATKNPFEPVVQIGTGTTTPSTAPSGTPSTTTPSGGTSPPPGGTTTTTAPSNAPPPGQTVTLVSVFRDSRGTVKARVEVGSTVYTVGQGQTFASGQYRVVSLDPPCGQFLFGDSPFRLCEGEQTIK